VGLLALLAAANLQIPASGWKARNFWAHGAGACADAAFFGLRFRVGLKLNPKSYTQGGAQGAGARADNAFLSHGLPPARWWASTNSVANPHTCIYCQKYSKESTWVTCLLSRMCSLYIGGEYFWVTTYITFIHIHTHNILLLLYTWETTHSVANPHPCIYCQKHSLEWLPYDDVFAK
jgi:hypothetical protein